MKLLILKENLKNGLNIVERITGKDITLPVLGNVLMESEKNFLKLSATNLETGINYWTLAKIQKEGKTTTPTKFLSNFINSLPDQKLELEVKANILHIICENQKTQIKGLNPEEFPIIPKIENENFITVNNRAFCQNLAQVVDFTAPSQTRPEISGIYLSFQKDNIRLAATDSFRLAEKTLSFKKKSDYTFSSSAQEYSLILPQKTALELINIFNEKEGNLKIYFSTNQVLFELPMGEVAHPQIQFISRLIEGEYPDYQEIIPKKYVTEVFLSRADFLNQIRTAGLFSGKTNEVKIKINPQDKKIEVFSQNPEIGENKSELPGKIEGKKLEVAFNFRFLLDGLTHLKGQEIVLGFSGEEGPALLKTLEDPNYLYVVMPIKS